MKNVVYPTVVLLVSPPGEVMPDTRGERRSAAHLNDPAQHWHRPAGASDLRPQVAASGTPQRVRARQTEPRTAKLCHVRTPRRPAGEGAG